MPLCFCSLLNVRTAVGLLITLLFSININQLTLNRLLYRFCFSFFVPNTLLFYVSITSISIWKRAASVRTEVANKSVVPLRAVHARLGFM